MHAHADDAARRVRAYLDEVAELVDQPQAAAADLRRAPGAPGRPGGRRCGRRRGPRNERRVLAPEAQRALAAAVADAVGGELVGGEDEVGGRAPVSPRRVACRRRSAATPTSGSPSKASSAAAGGSGSGVGTARRSARRSSGAARRRRPPRPRRVGAPAPLEHLAARARAVSYGQSEPPGRRVGEGEVEQRLVALALDELGWCGRARSARRSLAPAPAAVRRRTAPGRDDPGRVAADLRHVGEPHPRRRRRGRAPRAAAFALGRGDRDEHRLTGGHARRGRTGRFRPGTPRHPSQESASCRYPGGSRWRIGVDRLRRPWQTHNPSPVVIARHVHVAGPERRDLARLGRRRRAADAAGVVGEQVDRDRRLGRGRAHAMDVVARREQRVEVARRERALLARLDRASPA